MKNKIDVIKQLIEECDEEDRRTWTDETRIVLEAVANARNSVSWQINSAIVKAFLEDAGKASGWAAHAAGKIPSEFIVENQGRSARILIVAQQDVARAIRMYPAHVRKKLYPIHLQKKQWKKHSRSVAVDMARKAPVAAPVEQLYSFADFDILAVNLRSVTRRWTDFRYTPSAGLAPAHGHHSRIHELQFVPLYPHDSWTDKLDTCLNWISDGNG